MAKIRIDFDALRQQAVSINSMNESYQQITTRFNNLTDQISTGWKGESAAAYVSKMKEYLVQGRKLIDVISAFRSYAVTTADTFEQTDRECASAIRNSF